MCVALTGDTHGRAISPKIPGGTMYTIVVWWRTFVVESAKAARFLREAAKTDNPAIRRDLTQRAMDAEESWEKTHRTGQNHYVSPIPLA